MIVLLLSLKSLPSLFFFSFIRKLPSLDNFLHVSHISLESNGLIESTSIPDVERIWLRERWQCGPCAFEIIHRRKAFISSLGAATAVKRFLSPPQLLPPSHLLNLTPIYWPEFSSLTTVLC